MEPRLAHHKSTPSIVGNHFNSVDQAARHRLGEPEDAKAREDRIIASMLTNARTGARAMARVAETMRRLRKDYLSERDILELLTTPGSLWMRQVWSKELVHPACVGYAQAYLEKVLREKGWRL